MAIVVHSMGDKYGAKLSNSPDVPRATSEARQGISPTSMSGRAISQSAPSQPTKRVLGGCTGWSCWLNKPPFVQAAVAESFWRRRFQTAAEPASRAATAAVVAGSGIAVIWPTAMLAPVVS